MKIQNIAAWLVCYICVMSLDMVQSFSIERSNVPGIWTLALQDPSMDDKDKKPLVSLIPTSLDTDISIKIEQDGSFQQCSNEDGTAAENPLCGKWELDDYELKLALDRKCSAQDMLLSGRINNDFSISRGVVSAGKFMYPPHHAAFFDQPMAACEKAGTFSLKQTFGFAKMRIPLEELENTPTREPQFQASDFYDEKFFMTIVPIECKVPPQQEWNSQKGGWYSPLDDLAVDIRTMPIEFFANNTFCANGVNKILRGRFEITEEDQLYFHVSRFGTGRSNPGSVFSEGKGLSHEDERSYLGTIEKMETNNNDTNLRVEGTVTFGNDLGTDARPEPVGTFLLHQVNDTSLEMKDEDEKNDDTSSNEDSIFDSVFE